MSKRNHSNSSTSHPPLPPSTKSSPHGANSIKLPKGFSASPSFSKADEHIAVPLTPLNAAPSSSPNRTPPSSGHHHRTPASILLAGVATPVSKSPQTARFPSFEAYDHESGASPLVRNHKSNNADKKNPFDSSSKPKANCSRLRKQQKKGLLLICSILVLVCGSIDGILGKLMNKQEVPKCPSCTPYNYFSAPFFVTFLMYIGELIVLGYFLIYTLFIKCLENRRANKLASPTTTTTTTTMSSPVFVSEDGVQQHPQHAPMTFGDNDSTHDGTEVDLAEIPLRDFDSFTFVDTRPHCPYYLWAIPMILDFTSAVLLNQALLMTPASVVQTLRNFNVIITALFSLIYLRVPLKVHQFIGIILVTGGMVCASVFYFTQPDPATNYNGSHWFGVILTIIGTTLTSSVFIVQEYLMRKYECNPLEGIGLQGLFGTMFSIVVLSIVNLAKIELFEETFYMISVGFTHSEFHSQSLTILLSAIFFVFSISIFNSTALTVTTFGSALLCTVLFTSRTAFIWLIELTIGWSPFNVYNLVGVILVTIAILIYNYDYIKGVEVDVEPLSGEDQPSSCCGHTDHLLLKPLYCGMKSRMKLLEDDDDDDLGVVSMKPLDPTGNQHYSKQQGSPNNNSPTTSKKQFDMCSYNGYGTNVV